MILHDVWEPTIHSGPGLELPSSPPVLTESRDRMAAWKDACTFLQVGTVQVRLSSHLTRQQQSRTLNVLFSFLPPCQRARDISVAPRHLHCLRTRIHALALAVGRLDAAAQCHSVVRGQGTWLTRR